MRKSSKIKADIARLNEQLKQAETREAERIGRLALKAGLGDIEIDDETLTGAFEELARRFREGGEKSTGKKEVGANRQGVTALQTGAPADSDNEA